MIYRKVGGASVPLDNDWLGMRRELYLLSNSISMFAKWFHIPLNG